jgi:hypothetical protein
MARTCITGRVKRSATPTQISTRQPLHKRSVRLTLGSLLKFAFTRVSRPQPTIRFGISSGQPSCLPCRGAVFTCTLARFATATRRSRCLPAQLTASLSRKKRASTCELGPPGVRFGSPFGPVHRIQLCDQPADSPAADVLANNAAVPLPASCAVVDFRIATYVEPPRGAYR